MRSTAILAALLLSACAPEPTSFNLDDPFSELPATEAGPPRAQLSASPAIIGENLTITLSNVPEGTIMQVGMSAGRGQGSCLQTLVGLCTDLTPPWRARQGVADATRATTVEIPIPVGVTPGAMIFVQVGADYNNQPNLSPIFSVIAEAPAAVDTGAVAP